MKNSGDIISPLQGLRSFFTTYPGRWPGLSYCALSGLKTMVSLQSLNCYKKMKPIDLLLTISITFLPGITYAQPLVLTDRDVDYVSITAINKQNCIIESRVKSNIKIIIPDGSGSDINNSGSIIVFDKLIQNSTGNPQVLELPKPKKEIVAPQFSTQDNILFFWDLDDAYTKTIHRYDLKKNAITYSQIFNTTRTFDEAFGHRKLSRDGLTLAMEMGSYLNIYEYIDNIFIKTAEIGRRPAFSNLDISKYGTRVFYYVLLEKFPSLVYVEKTDSGWSKENFINIPFLAVEGDDLPRMKAGIANNGKTIITYTGIKIVSTTQWLSIIHEENGKWGQPEDIGTYEIIMKPTGKAWDGYFVFEAKIYNSEDGKVIVVQQPRELSHAIIPGEYVVVSYDIFVFVQDNAGRWHKHQVNPPDVGADGYNDILLSPNGEQLYWVPEKTLSGIPWGNQIK